MGGLCVVDAAPGSLAAGDPELACAATAAPCGRIALDASARCVWETEACSDCVCSCAIRGAPRAGGGGSTGCTKVRAATDVSAAGRSISEKTTAALAVAPIAAATTKRRVVRSKFGAGARRAVGKAENADAAMRFLHRVVTSRRSDGRYVQRRPYDATKLPQGRAISLLAVAKALVVPLQHLRRGFLFERPVPESDPTVDTDCHWHSPVSLTLIGTGTV